MKRRLAHLKRVGLYLDATHAYVAYQNNRTANDDVVPLPITTMAFCKQPVLFAIPNQQVLIHSAKLDMQLSNDEIWNYLTRISPNFFSIEIKELYVNWLCSPPGATHKYYWFFSVHKTALPSNFSILAAEPALLSLLRYLSHHHAGCLAGSLLLIYENSLLSLVCYDHQFHGLYQEPVDQLNDALVSGIIYRGLLALLPTINDMPLKQIGWMNLSDHVYSFNLDIASQFGLTFYSVTLPTKPYFAVSRGLLLKEKGGHA